MNNIGTKIYGFCNGFFGREDYNDKIIIAEGKRWILCAYLDTRYDFVTVCNFDNENEKEEFINNWSKEEK